ncbi:MULTISPECIES: DUF5666 domain-containing protein [unclassified Nocardioides]|uniref:DUF5666 domain-containing protein n=1 Tax=unclassified Nocardioides TaxID=2615069 RepID=UPI0006F6BAE7|nr:MULTISPECIES: DUF5666 domain-containing protein [unclassified Nocardioides]KRA29394.1 hypothetical protein ASD81_20605 [Nocardioides sp. Root614]KRA85586.1 hypothetical protein ASD84_24365 [Nocardioides sp. Root682]
MSLNLLVLPLRPIGALATGVALAGLLVGCGSDDAANDPATAASSNGAVGAPAGAPGRMPGTFGEIAAVDGDTLQVRSQMAGQVAVTVTDATTVTDQAVGTLADVRTGACVVVRSAGTGDGSTTESAPPTEVDAASVSLVAAGDDGCDVVGMFGGGPGGGERPSGMPTDLPSDLPTDLPTDRPSGMPDGGRMGGFGANGEVTAVTATGFVVKGTDGEVTVTVGGETTYTKQVASDATALTVGRCVRVDGDADDAGAVTAETIQVSDAVNDQCGR